MKKQKTIRITVNVSEGMKEKIAEIMEKSSLMSQTHVVNNAILLLHQKTFKDYIENRPSGKMTVEDKVDYELKRSDIKKQKHEEKQKAFCVRLDGKLERSNSGFVCRYFNYSRQGKHEQVLPLDYLNEEIIENQYQPSKEKLKELIKNGVINLDLK